MTTDSTTAAPATTWLSPAKMTCLLTFMGIGWLYLADKVAASVPRDILPLDSSAGMKLALYLTATVALLYLLIRNYVQRLNVSQKSAELAEQELTLLSSYDSETGLPNYSLLLDRLNQAIALGGCRRSSAAVIYVSLTGFKSLIDVRGHSGGAEALRGIAQRLVSLVSQRDTVARIHRDEFVLVLGETGKEDAVTGLLNKLQGLFAESLRLGAEETLIPACFGVACFPADGMTGDELLQHAHIAVNQARRNGVTVQYYSEELNVKAAQRQSIEIGLVRALEANEFTLCYQPKISIIGGTIMGMEALVRWDRPGVGMVLPNLFIPVAEESGLIVRLGAYVLREACRQNREWQDAGLPNLKVAVNLSPRQLSDDGFIPLVMEILEETGMDPCLLEFELTESSLIGDVEMTIAKLRRLKELGISISVDDFGTGYSSLSYLKHLPLDTIKIDQSFVRDIVTDPDDAAIVGAIVAMAHALKLNVIAEGVETFQQLQFLHGCNCQQVQGYYFSRPLEPRQFVEFVVREVSLRQGSRFEAQGSKSEVQGSRFEVQGPHSPVPVVPECIGGISLPVAPAHPEDNLDQVLTRFQSDPGLLVLPVVAEGRLVGIINRAAFLEGFIIGLHGYALHINHSKKMRELMAPVKLQFDASVRIKDVAQIIQSRKLDVRVDNICVIRDGIYYGVVDVNRFISAMTDINLVLAKGANPLTGLPGNESIQREINDRLRAGDCFDIAYIDIDNFKPFNDYYGFQRGDVVIKKIGDIIADVIQAADRDSPSFCGHIGGDDFIAITGPNHLELLSRNMATALGLHLRELHGEEDHAAGCYHAANRKGELETFGLLSLSIGIVNTLLTPVSSYAQLASLATEVKKAAKKTAGSSVVVNRRIVEGCTE